MLQKPRRWLQFGLRTLLLLMLVLCIGLSFFVHRAKQHQRLIAELDALGVQVDVATPPNLPRWFRSLVGDHLLGATYSASIIGGPKGEQMRKIRELPSVETIVLVYSHSEVYSKAESDTEKIRRELASVEKTIVIKGDR